jgi:hypothetical protein
MFADSGLDGVAIRLTLIFDSIVLLVITNKNSKS